MAERVEIKVTDDSGKVESGKEAVILSVRNGDTVRWVSDCKSDCTIVFSSNDGSPFNDRVFTLRSGGNIDSGAISRRQGGVGVYKYSVMGSTGNNDPIIIVKD
jgi:hypothetical protein